jgi:hypothetical protein
MNIFGLGLGSTKAKKNPKFPVGTLVQYTGVSKNYKDTMYQVEKVGSPTSNDPKYLCKPINSRKKATVLFSENVLIKSDDEGLGKLNKNEVKEGITIQDIDARAKQIQRASGVKEKVKVKYYNISRAEAKKMAFKELK